MQSKLVYVCDRVYELMPNGKQEIQPPLTNQRYGARIWKALLLCLLTILPL